jgi:hypothetical protein
MFNPSLPPPNCINISTWSLLADGPSNRSNELFVSEPNAVKEKPFNNAGIVTAAGTVLRKNFLLFIVVVFHWLMISTNDIPAGS